MNSGENLCRAASTAVRPSFSSTWYVIVSYGRAKPIPPVIGSVVNFSVLSDRMWSARPESGCLARSTKSTEASLCSFT